MKRIKDALRRGNYVNVLLDSKANEFLGRCYDFGLVTASRDPDDPKSQTFQLKDNVNVKRYGNTTN